MFYINVKKINVCCVLIGILQRKIYFAGLYAFINKLNPNFVQPWGTQLVLSVSYFDNNRFMFFYMSNTKKCFFNWFIGCNCTFF